MAPCPHTGPSFLHQTAVLGTPYARSATGTGGDPLHLLFRRPESEVLRSRSNDGPAKLAMRPDGLYPFSDRPSRSNEQIFYGKRSRLALPKSIRCPIVGKNKGF